MDRRGFLKMFGGAVGGGLVASATMAEAGMLAEFMSWLQRKPAWSFPTKRHSRYLYGDINAATLEYIVPALPDSVFKASPVFMRLRGVPDYVPAFLQHVEREMDRQTGKFDLRVA